MATWHKDGVVAALIALCIGIELLFVLAMLAHAAFI